MKKLILRVSFYLIAGSVVLISCKKKTTEPIPEVVTPTSYTVPTTYNFEKADTTASRLHLSMLAELTTYIKTTHSNTVAPVLDAQKLKDLFANVNGYYTTEELNGATSLKSKCAINFQTDLESNFNGIVLASQNAAADPTKTTASDGVSGKLITGTRYILVDTAGIEYKEFAEKGLMNAVLYYQASNLLNSISTLDNTTKTDGTTAQEKAWDQAFAYFGVPVNFPTVVTGLKNWGSYCNSVSNALAGNTTNDATSVNAIIMKAWITGRAAISNKDVVTRDAAVVSVLRNWEKVIAARFITYAKGALSNIASPATYHHNLSEAVGFINAFAYNSTKSISDSDIEVLKNYFKTNGSINLYKVTTTNLNNAIAKMAFLYNLDASKL
jgi:hypothetical protein